MESFLTPLIFLFLGAAIGSFLNVVIDRLARGEDLILSRSYCEKCKKKLLSRDLFPIISFLVLRGRCRFCKFKIPPRLLWVEILTAIFFVFFYFGFISGFLVLPELIYSVIIFCLFEIIFFTDIEHGIIPDKILVIFTGVVLVYTVLFKPQIFLSNLLTGVALFAIFMLIFILTRARGMGFGDVKLSFALGLYLGFPKVIVGLYSAFLTGAIVGVILILWGKKKLKKDTIPFGPFLVASSFIAYFFGDIILGKILTILTP